LRLSDPLSRVRQMQPTLHTLQGGVSRLDNIKGVVVLFLGAAVAMRNRLKP
jgi:hypothetical protein